VVVNLVNRTCHSSGEPNKLESIAYLLILVHARHAMPSTNKKMKTSERLQVDNIMLMEDWNVFVSKIEYINCDHDVYI
jgi:hypothetical protein